MSDRLFDNPDLAEFPKPGVVRFRGGPFSNFAVCRIVLPDPWRERALGRCEYLTVEHRFQAMKASTADEHDYVNRAPTARDAKTRGNEIKMRSDWEGDLRLDVMREALAEKFKQPHFRDTLLRTGNDTLIESAPWDPFWGDGPDGTGKNWLGKLLMELREGLRGSR